MTEDLEQMRKTALDAMQDAALARFQASQARSELAAAARENAELRGEVERLSLRSDHSKLCPITGRKFFMTLEHPERGTVATYGGPFDSYTIPEPDEDGCFRSERYDHDRGQWMEGGEPERFHILTDTEHNELWETAKRAESAEQQAEALRSQLATAQQCIEILAQFGQPDEIAKDLERLWELLEVDGQPYEGEDCLSHLIAHKFAQGKLESANEGAEALAGIGDEIQRIMRVYREQAASPYGVDTPGGLEHMGDIWNLFSKWDASLSAYRAAQKGAGE